jgi:hypothetical protein
MRFYCKPVRCIFARGHWWQNLILLCRGYRRHETLFGWVMRKDVTDD